MFRPRLSVALVGPDGAGKSTISAHLRQARLPAPVTTIYMGVNLEASTLMLPTTRLLLAAKRARGGRPDLVASSLRDIGEAPAAPSGRGAAWRNTARLTVWMTEEWLRQLVAVGHGLRGRIVIFDRHFYLDYYHADVDAELRAAGGHDPAIGLEHQGVSVIAVEGCWSGSTRSPIS